MMEIGFHAKYSKEEFELFILRFFISVLSGYLIYYLSLTWIECLKETHKITMTAFINRFYELIELKLSFALVTMVILSTYLAWNSAQSYSVLWQAFAVFSFCMCLIMMAYIDMKTMLIPTACLYALILIGIPFLFQPFDHSLLQRLLGCVAAAGLMQGVNMVKRDSFGLGDIKLMLISGFYLGYGRIMIAMLSAILSGGMFAVYVILRKKAVSHSHIAFVPFLCFGIITAIFFGDELMLSYFSLFYS